LRRVVDHGCRRLAAASEEGPPNDARARRFVQQYEANIRPLEIEANRRTWTASVTGTDEDFRKKQEAEERLSLRLADPQPFAELKAIKEAGVSDPLLAREIAVLYLEYLEKQVPPELLKEMLAKSNKIERAFNVFRAKVEGKELTDNEVRRVLIDSRDSAKCRAAWEASKAVGPAVLANLKELLALRNQAAHKLGFKDFYVMRLYLGEQDDQQVLKLFDELDELTRAQFHRAKGEMDAALAQRYGVATDELRPWNYQDPFFQEPPAVGVTLPESIYKDLDIVGLVRTFYDGVGLPIDDIIRRSDLFEKPARISTPSARTWTAKGTSASWRTSCPTRNGWAPRCTSSGTRSTRRMFPTRSPMPCGPRPTRSPPKRWR